MASTLDEARSAATAAAADADPSSSTDIDGTSKKEYNIFRDSLLRYAGYANEVGESFRYQFPRLVLPTYAVSFGYCFADAASTGYSTYCNYSSEDDCPSSSSTTTTSQKQQQPSRQDLKYAATTGAFLDTLLWQSLASVAVPGATINLLVRAARFAVPRSPVALPVVVAQWLPTAVGLGSIPVIVHPIDQGVDLLLDSSVRQYYNVR